MIFSRLILVKTLLFAFSVSLLLIISQNVDPQASVDASYYHIMAQSLLRGDGLNEPFIWQRLNNYDQIVHPIDYWMPGGIFLYSIAIFFMGNTGEVVLNIIIWSTLSLLIFSDVYKDTNRYLSAFFAYMFFLAAGRMIFFLLTSDNIAFYAAIGYLCFRFLNSVTNLHVKAGFAMGLAILTRIDGMIFSLLSIPVVFYKTRKLKLVVGFIATIFIVILPWLLRNSLVLDRFWPSNVKALLVTDYEDIFYEGFTGSMREFLAQDSSQIVQQRIDGLCHAFFDLVVIPSEFIFFPFILVGLMILRKNGSFLFTYYLLTILFISGVFFPFQSQKGTSMHISSFFFPYFAYVVGFGFDAFMKLNRFQNWFKMSVFLVCLSWSSYITFSSVNNYMEKYATEKDKYRELFVEYKPASDHIVVSREPIFVYEFTACRGVIWSKLCDLDPFKTADRFCADYIIADNKSFSGIASWTFVASSEDLFLYRRVDSALKYE